MKIILCKQLCLQVNITTATDLYTVIWFQVFKSNANNFQIDFKNLFLRKKSSRPCAALDSARVEKGDIIPDNTVQKSDFPIFLEDYY